MRFVIEIPEEELNAVVRQKVQQRLQEQASKYTSDQYVGKQVQDRWSAAVDQIIAEEFADQERIREMVRLRMEKKISAQLQRLFRMKKSQETDHGL